MESVTDVAYDLVLLFYVIGNDVSQAYLIWGYCKTQSEEYAFEWTIPQCVVTLRLIAIAFDVYDGSQIRRQDKKKSSSHSNGSDGQTREQSNGDSIPKSAAPSTCNPENPSKAFPESKEHVVCNGNNSAILNDSTETTCSSSSPRISKSDGVTVLSSSSSIHWNEDALLEEPSLLQMLAHCYFPASFLVGPQFGLKQYLEFVRVNNSFLDKRFVHTINILLFIAIVLCVSLPFAS